MHFLKKYLQFFLTLLNLVEFFPAPGSLVPPPKFDNKSCFIVSRVNGMMINFYMTSVLVIFG